MKPETRMAAVILAGLAMLACGRNEPASGEGSKGAVPSPATSAPSSGGPPTTAEDTARIDTHPAPLSAAPAPAPSAPPGAAPVPAGPAPGTLSLRFIVRKRETKDELPAGAFEVRLVPIDPIRDGSAAGGSPGASPPRAGVTTEAPHLAQGTPIAPSSSARAPGATYQGAPEQVLVTQLDGTKRTYLAGVRPGSYAMRITAKGRRMLLEVLTVKAEDRLVERALEAE